MYPDFETNPNLMMSLVIEIAPMANQQLLVSFFSNSNIVKIDDLEYCIQALEKASELN